MAKNNNTIEINKKELSEILNMSKSCIQNTGFIKIFENFCFSKNTVKSTNGTQSMTIQIPFDFPVKGCIKADSLIKLINSYNSDTIKITIEEEKIKVNTATFNMLPISEFTYKGNYVFENDNIIDLTDEIINNIEFCLPCITNSILDQQNGLSVFIKDKVLSFGATNGIVASFVTSKIESELDISLIIPKEFCSLLIKFYKLGKINKLYISNNLVAGIGEEITIDSKINTNVKLLDYEKVVNKYKTENNSILHTSTDELISILDRAILLGDKEKVSTINIDSDNLIIETETPSILIKDSIQFENLKDEEFKFKTNINYFKNIVTSTNEYYFNVEGENDVVTIGESKDKIILLASINE
jgi:hypothetical protein